MIVGRTSSARTVVDVDIPKKTSRETFSLGEEVPTTTETTRSPNIGAELSLLTNIELQRDGIDEAISRARRGEAFSPAELLALQAQVYQYAQQLEVVSRVVDRTVGAVKTALNVQV